MKRRPHATPVSVADAVAEARLAFLGLADYQKVHRLQLAMVDARRDGALAHDVFLVTEHPRVYTLGRRGGREHLMVTDAFLAHEKIKVLPIERGGVITYHGPGQLVIYPIIDLRKAKLTVAEYVYLLEETMVAISGGVGVVAGRDPRNHGVWVGDCKLGSIGIAIRHGVAFHGLAINVNIDLAPFTWVNPCGLTGVTMTSLSRETGRLVAMEEVNDSLNSILQRVFGRTFTETLVAGGPMEEILYGATI